MSEVFVRENLTEIPVAKTIAEFLRALPPDNLTFNGSDIELDAIDKISIPADQAVLGQAI